MIFMKRKVSKKGMTSEILPYIIIALAILVILGVLIFVLKGKGSSLIGKLNGMFR